MIRETCIMIFSAVICFGKSVDYTYKTAKESEKYCASTAVVKPTPQMIIYKVNLACKLVQKEGTRAFSKFKGKGSNYIFAGTYLWINDLNGKMLMHPITPRMENHDVLGLKDANGKQFIKEMINIAKKKGEGWVDYTWNKPNSQAPSLKLNYVKMSYCNGVPVIIGCSIDDRSVQQVSYISKAKKRTNRN